MNSEMNRMDPELESAVSEIRDEPIDDAVVEAAAARVWARLSEAGAAAHAAQIRSCADFQALFAEYRAGKLSDARALLLKDHLNTCVACRRAFDGKLVSFPTPDAARMRAIPARHMMRWAAAAVVVVAAGVSVWYATGRYGWGSGRAYVQTVDGALFELTAGGIRPLAAGQDLHDGVAIRTAKDSSATLRLRDGSTVEMRERSEFSASQSGGDLTVYLGRGNVLVHAAKRSAGHLFVSTADFRVAVTGTVFSVNAGVKGSRVSVIEGSVRVAEGNQETTLRPGQQSVAGPNLDPAPILYDVEWSREGKRMAAAGNGTQNRASALLDRAPASTAFFALVPNASESIGDAREMLRRLAAQSPQLQAVTGQKEGVEPVLAALKGAGEYLNELAFVVIADPSGKEGAPVFLASLKRGGFGDYLKKAGLPLTVVETSGFAAFGPKREAVEQAAASLSGQGGGFQASPCYERLSGVQREGATVAACADLSRLGDKASGSSYLVFQDRRVNGEPEVRATVGFNGPRTGMASWLAAPAPMGSLDYVSPEATFLAAFVVKSPAAIIDETVALRMRSQENVAAGLQELQRQTGIDVRNDLAACLGGEFAVAVDGPLIPTPSWKLIAEVYDPARFQATLRKIIEIHNREAAKANGRQMRFAQETVGGRTFYMVGSADGNPLLEAHYTFADGYLIAAPSTALITQALQAKSARTSIARSTRFVSLTPRDHYANFSAVVYQNLGTSLAPIVGLLGAFVPQGGQMPPNALQQFGNLKPTLVAVYGEPDRITIAGRGEMLGMSVHNMMSGSLLGIAGQALPLAQLQGTSRR